MSGSLKFRHHFFHVFIFLRDPPVEVGFLLKMKESLILTGYPGYHKDQQEK